MTAVSGLPLILASASPRRRELLERLGIRFTPVAAEIDESPLPGERPTLYAERIAVAKARTVAQKHASAFVLAADTVVIVDQTILGKPAGPAQARAMLEHLAGRTHEVATAYCLLGPGAPRARVVSTEVDVAPLSPAEISAYLASEEWQGKAGGYAIQGRFAYAVRAIRGSYTNVVGLPLAEVIAELRAAGALADFPAHALSH